MPAASGANPLELMITSCTTFPFGSICQQGITIGTIDSITGFGAGIEHPIGASRAFDDSSGTFGQILSGTGILVEDAARPRRRADQHEGAGGAPDVRGRLRCEPCRRK